MNAERLFQIIGLIDDEIIVEADREFAIKRKNFTWRKTVAIAACISVVCLASVQLYLYQSLPNTDDPNSQTVNPMAGYETVEELSKVLGFDVKEPIELPQGYSCVKIGAIMGKIAEIQYSDGQSTFKYRMAKIRDDISGDFAEYAITKEIKAGNVTVTAKGNGTAFNVAVWKSGEYSFSITSDGGLTQEEIIKTVNSIDMKE